MNNKHNIAKTALTVALFGATTLVMAQKNGQVLKGRVVDTEGNPIPGAVVNVAEQSRIALTDKDGYFSLKGVKVADEINVQSVGYQNTTGDAILDGSFTVVMEPEISQYQKETPVPFGQHREILATEAKSVVTGTTLERFPITILQNAFTSTVNGMETYEWSAEPGWTETQMYIRGIRTWNKSARNPLVIVDNVERDLSFLDAYPIESITILKDAAASAIYGMRGANGVIMVTTKRGQSGKTKINFTQEVGWQSLSDHMENQNSYNMCLTRNRVQYLSGGTPMYTDEQIEKYRRVCAGEELEGIDKYKYFNTSWFDQLYRDDAPQTKTNFQISGGNDRARYYVSFSWLNQGGMWNDKYTSMNEGYDTQHVLNRYNLRSNIDIDINKYLNVQMDLGGRIDDIVQPTASVFNLTTFGAVENLPIYPVYCPNGEVFQGPSGDSPLHQLGASGQEKNRRRNLYATVTVNADLAKVLPGLKAFGTVSFDSFETFESTQRNDIDTYTYDFDNEAVTDVDQFTYKKKTSFSALSNPSANQREYYNHLNMNGGLAYERNFGKHYINARAFIRAYRSTVKAAESSQRNLSYNGQLTYSWNDRYVLSGNYSHMGEDNFAPEERWGDFWGASAAWNLSEESWLKNKSWIDLLKVRASYGSAGMNATGAGRYPYQSTFGSVTGYAFGFSASNVSGFGETLAGNPNNKWEVSEMLNLGLDFDFWGGKLYGNFDGFKEWRSNILVDLSTIPSLIGVNVAKDSYGTAESWGWEGKLGHRGKLGKQVNYFVEMQATYNDNKITEMDEAEPSVEWQRKTGRRIYDNSEVAEIYERAFDGGIGGWNIYKFQQWASDPALIATSQADAQMHPEKYPYNTASGGSQPLGTAVFKDMNGDRQIDSNDMVPDTYTMIPRWVLSANLGAEWKGIDVKATLTAYLDRNVFISPAMAWSGWGNMGTHEVVHAWGYFTDDPNDPRNVNARYPRPVYNGYNPIDSERSTGTYKNDIFIMNGDYLSLRNVEVGYSLPKSWISKLWMTNCRVYFNAYNVCNWSHLPKGLDPEKPMSYCWWYPKTRSFNFGINIGF